MRQIVTARLGGEYGDLEKIADRVQVERAARIGCLMNDKYSSPARNYDKIHCRNINFDEIVFRTVSMVTVTDDYVVFDQDSIYIDTSIFSLNLNSEDRALSIGREYQRKIDAQDAARTANFVEGVAILTSNEGSGTWGHWVVHNFPRVAVAARKLPDAKILVPQSYYGSRANFGELLTLFGIDESRVVKTHINQIYLIETAVIVDYLYSKNAIHPIAMNMLSQVSNAVKDDGAYEPERILVKRSTPGKRDIANESEVDAAMLSYGFELRVLGQESLRTQIKAWRRSGAIASVLGSDLTNIVFGQSDLSIAALTPAHFGDDFFFDLAAAKGYKWNELFCGQIAEAKPQRINSSFVVDTGQLKDFVTGAGLS